MQITFLVLLLKQNAWKMEGGLQSYQRLLKDAPLFLSWTVSPPSLVPGLSWMYSQVCKKMIGGKITRMSLTQPSGLAFRRILESPGIPSDGYSRSARKLTRTRRWQDRTLSTPLPLHLGSYWKVQGSSHFLSADFYHPLGQLDNSQLVTCTPSWQTTSWTFIFYFISCHSLIHDFYWIPKPGRYWTHGWFPYES